MEESDVHYYYYEEIEDVRSLADLKKQCASHSVDSGFDIILHLHAYTDDKCNMDKRFHEVYRKGVMAGGN